MMIAVMVIIDVSVATGIVHGDDAINLLTVSATPGTPRLLATPMPASTPQGPAATAAQKAEQDDSDSLPGRFVATQGRQHLGTYPLDHHVPFCREGRIANDCYASNPPTSGWHLPVQGTVLLEDGNRLKIPPDPGVYDFQIPREAIPHIEEHAGVYIGYNCSSDGCAKAAERLKNLVTQEISLGGRIVLSPDPDLDDDTIGMAAWTRVDNLDASDYSDERVRAFIKAHSCRFDPELFCPTRPTL
jgi:hypothetical protein